MQVLLPEEVVLDVLLLEVLAVLDGGQSDAQHLYINANIRHQSERPAASPTETGGKNTCWTVD